MNDDLAWVLARVASGELSPEEADPLVAALTGGGLAPATDAGPETGQPEMEQPEVGRPQTGRPQTGRPGAQPATSDGSGASRVVRVLVLDAGRQVVNLRIPMSLASLAGTVIPGLPEAQVARLQQAIRDGQRGTILDVRDPDGSGVVIATE